MMSSGPKVLHALAWTGEVSGAVRSMEESLAALRADGVDARAWLAISGPDPGTSTHNEAVARLERRGIPVTVRPTRSWLDPGAVAALRKVLVALGARALLHTHGERALLWGRGAARLAGADHVHTEHGVVAGDQRGRRRVRVGKRLTRGLAAVIAVDPATSIGCPDARVVPNCLDAAAFRAEAQGRDEVRDSLGLAPDVVCCLFLGRLSPEKGADLLAVLQAELQEQQKGSAEAPAQLLVAGTGPLALGAAAITAIRLLGDRSDAASLLAAADVLLMPSKTEGLPMVALEAAAMGTPVVAFPAGGLADSGLAACVPAGDAGALVRVALALAGDSVRRAERLETAAESLSSRFGPRLHSQALQEIYRHVRGD